MLLPRGSRQLGKLMLILPQWLLLGWSFSDLDLKPTPSATYTQAPVADIWTYGILCGLHKDALPRFQISPINGVQIPRRDMVTWVFPIKHADHEGIHISSGSCLQGDKRLKPKRQLQTDSCRTRAWDLLEMWEPHR